MSEHLPAWAARDRVPYVGQGVDGCLRSAQIDREEADTYDLADPRLSRCLDSALGWEDQAQRWTTTAPPAQ